MQRDCPHCGVGHIAFAYETYSYRIALSDGHMIERDGVATSVLTHEGDAWKIVRYHCASPGTSASLGICGSAGLMRLSIETIGPADRKLAFLSITSSAACSTAPHPSP